MIIEHHQTRGEMLRTRGIRLAAPPARTTRHQGSLGPRACSFRAAPTSPMCIVS
jgi:hypothetical protein